MQVLSPAILAMSDKTTGDNNGFQIQTCSVVSQIFSNEAGKASSLKLDIDEMGYWVLAAQLQAIEHDMIKEVFAKLLTNQTAPQVLLLLRA